jgi:hypothetical protein
MVLLFTVAVPPLDVTKTPLPEPDAPFPEIVLPTTLTTPPSMTTPAAGFPEIVFISMVAVAPVTSMPTIWFASIVLSRIVAAHDTVCTPRPTQFDTKLLLIETLAVPVVPLHDSPAPPTAVNATPSSVRLMLCAALGLTFTAGAVDDPQVAMRALGVAVFPGPMMV